MRTFSEGISILCLLIFVQQLNEMIRYTSSSTEINVEENKRAVFGVGTTLSLSKEGSLKQKKMARPARSLVTPQDLSAYYCTIYIYVT
jgi:hypothetical protein